MSQASKPRRPLVTVLACITALPAIVIGVGACFHTSFEPAAFGKYSWAQVIFLAAWFIIAVPASYAFGRFLFSTQTIKLSRGRTAAVTPATKISWALFVGLPLLVIGDQLMQMRIREQTMTMSTDEYHPFLQNAPKPGRDRYHINQRGFRGEEIKKRKPAGTYRVFVIGGSTVFCGRAEWGHTHVRRLELALREKYPNRTIEVQNAGGEWHCSEHATIKFLFYLQDFDPDLIIIYHGVNDLLRSLVPDEFANGRYRDDYGHYYGSMSNFVMPRFTAFQTLRRHGDFWFSDFRKDRIRLTGPYGEGVRGATMYLLPKSKPIEIDKWPSVRAFERNMRDFAAIVQAKGVKLIMATQPHMYREDLTETEQEVIWFPQTHHEDGTRPSIASMRRGMNEINDAARRVATDAGAGFVDLDKLVPKSFDYMYDDVHYTPKGNETVAAAFFEHIVAASLIDPNPPAQP